MLITSIIENTTSNPALAKEHGLCLYIEVNQRKVLFDTGQSTSFLTNAEKLKVAISEIDTVILSHGHYDHGGGLPAFLEVNQKAKIYMSRHAFGHYYSHRSDGTMKYIGIDQKLKTSKRIQWVDKTMMLGDGMELFMNQSSAYAKPPMNRYLYKEETGSIKDDFQHEINLSIQTEKGFVLIAGCAHAGILNICDSHKYRFGAWPDHVIGGFHLSSGSRKEVTDPAYLESFGEHLVASPSDYYTCHCTGVETYKVLQEVMRERLTYFSGGMRLAF